MEIIFAVLAGAIVSGGVVWLAMTITRQAERIKKLEDANAKHLPYPTIDAIEDLIATLNSEAFRNEFKMDLLNNALAHAYKARSGNGKKHS